MPFNSFNDKRAQFIKSITEGSIVAESDQGGDYVLVKVARLTKTQIVLENGGRFRRTNGLLVGGDLFRRGLLSDPNEPHVIKGLVQQRLRRSHVKLAKAVDALRTAPNTECLVAVKIATMAYERALEDLEAL
jgi:hypothetical protein